MTWKKYTLEERKEIYEVAKALAGEKRGHVWILPEINKHEAALREALGLSTSNGFTPDHMMSIGSFKVGT